MTDRFIHPSALVECESIGPGTRIWAFTHLLPGAAVGANCNIGDHCFVETGAVIRNNVTIKNHVCVWDGITIEDDVFIGPQVAFTNDRYPRSPRMEKVRARYERPDNWLVKTVLEQGCSVGANATILGGIRLGRYCLIAAGATVTADVEPFALMVGTPARKTGYVCPCGEKLGRSLAGGTRCPTCGQLLDENTNAA